MLLLQMIPFVLQPQKLCDVPLILLFLQIILEEVYVSLIPHEGQEVSVLVHPKRVCFPNTWITNWPGVDHIGPVFVDVFGVLLVDEVKEEVAIKLMEILRLFSTGEVCVLNRRWT